MRRSIFGLGILVCVSLAGCGRQASSARTESVDAAAPFYELYAAGDAITDQAAGAPGSHSSLVGTYEEGASVQDADFTTNVAKVALAAGAKLFFSFGQCYSGGFLDDLAVLGGSQTVISSARHTETASYGYEAPEGVDVDFTDAFLTGLGDGTNSGERVAAITAELDPFGPNPDAPRISEEMGSEHTQLMMIGDGGGLKPADYAADGLAVLWAGMPAERDGTQMNLMIERLVAMGYARSRIWLMYGEGEAVADHPVAKNHIVQQDEPVHLLAATRDHLVDLFAQQFAAENTAKPSFVFFYVGDHGGLDAAAVAKRNFRKPDSGVTPLASVPPGGRLYGEGFRKLIP